jgi:hypothetical protein
MVLDQRPACFETRAFAALLSMRGAENGRLNLPHAEEARKAVSKHAGWRAQNNASRTSGRDVEDLA